MGESLGNNLNEPTARRTGPAGIGGWLIVLLLGIWASSAARLAIGITALIPILRVPGAFTHRPPAAILPAATSVFVGLVGAVAGYLLARKKTKGPVLAKILLLVECGYYGASLYAALHSAGPLTVSPLPSWARPAAYLLACILGLGYLFRSRRLVNTFYYKAPVIEAPPSDEPDPRIARIRPWHEVNPPVQLEAAAPSDPAAERQRPWQESDSPAAPAVAEITDPPIARDRPWHQSSPPRLPEQETIALPPPTRAEQLQQESQPLGAYPALQAYAIDPEPTRLEFRPAQRAEDPPPARRALDPSPSPEALDIHAQQEPEDVHPAPQAEEAQAEPASQDFYSVSQTPEPEPEPELEPEEIWHALRSAAHTPTPSPEEIHPAFRAHDVHPDPVQEEPWPAPLAEEQHTAPAAQDFHFVAQSHEAYNEPEATDHAIEEPTPAVGYHEIHPAFHAHDNHPELQHEEAWPPPLAEDQHPESASQEFASAPEAEEVHPEPQHEEAWPALHAEEQSPASLAQDFYAAWPVQETLPEPQPTNGHRPHWDFATEEPELEDLQPTLEDQFAMLKAQVLDGITVWLSAAAKNRAHAALLQEARDADDTETLSQKLLRQVNEICDHALAVHLGRFPTLPNTADADGSLAEELQKWATAQAALRLTRSLDVRAAMEVNGPFDKVVEDRGYLLAIVEKNASEDAFSRALEIADYNAYPSPDVACMLVLKAQRDMLEAEMWAQVVHLAGDPDFQHRFEEAGARAFRSSVQFWRAHLHRLREEHSPFRPVSV